MIYIISKLYLTKNLNMYLLLKIYKSISASLNSTWKFLYQVFIWMYNKKLCYLHFLKRRSTFIKKNAINHYHPHQTSLSLMYRKKNSTHTALMQYNSYGYIIVQHLISNFATLANKFKSLHQSCCICWYNNTLIYRLRN